MLPQSQADPSCFGAPKIAVFVGDPRYMVMKDCLHARLMMTGMSNGQGGDDLSMHDFLNAGFESCDGLCTVQTFGGCLRSAAAWARAEAEAPDRIRLFFIEDFLLQPEVAVRGLARFLDVPMIGDATARAIAQAKDLAGMLKYPRRVGPLTVHQAAQRDFLSVDSFEEFVTGFERELSVINASAQSGWTYQLSLLQQCPSSQMQSLAHYASMHAPWDPPKWWAAHNARLCRPCIFFPRGACADDDCAFCHGQGHPKPKRPPKSRRNRRKRFDRTPSPERDHPAVKDTCCTADATIDTDDEWK